MDPNTPVQPPVPVQPIPPVVPTPTVEIVPPPPAKKTSLMFILGIILLSISVLALAGYFIFQSLKPVTNTPSPSSSPVPVVTTDPTVNWQIYTNSLFSFKYPSSWKVSNSEGVSGSGDYHYLIDLTIDGYQYGPNPATVSISYWDNPQLLDIPAFQARYKDALNQPSLYEPAFTVKSIGQGNGYYNKEGKCDPVACETYIIAYKDKIYIFNLFTQSATQYRQVIDQILSTFYFISNTNSPS